VGLKFGSETEPVSLGKAPYHGCWLWRWQWGNNSMSIVLHKPSTKQVLVCSVVLEERPNRVEIMVDCAPNYSWRSASEHKLHGTPTTFLDPTVLEHKVPVTYRTVQVVKPGSPVTLRLYLNKFLSHNGHTGRCQGLAMASYSPYCTLRVYPGINRGELRQL